MKGVCVVVGCFIVHTVKALQPKQVNLELETVLKFDKKDHQNDLALINQVQNVLEKIKHAMRSRTIKRRSSNDISFTDFILEAAEILKDFNDNDLEDTFAVIEDESKKYIYKESNLQELFGNRDVRRYVSDQLDVLRDMPADTLRRHLNTAINIIKDKQGTGENNDLLDIGNSLYDGASEELKKALHNLDRVRRSNVVNLENVLKDTLRSLVFDHYTKLRHNVKNELINMVKHYWRAFSNKKLHKKTTPRTLFNVKKWTAFLPHRINPPTTKRYTKNKGKPFLLDLHYNPDDKNKKKGKVFHDLTRTQKLHKNFLTNADSKKSMEEEGIKDLKVDSGSISDSMETFGMTKDKKDHRKLKSKKNKSHTELSYTKGLNSRESYDEVTDPINLDVSKLRAGEQEKGDILFRGESEGISKEHDDQFRKEIVINYSNVFDVGLSRRSPAQINISVASAERYGNGDLENGEKDENGRKQFTVFPATISTEGISIEHFDKGNTNKVMRKSNANDTLESDMKPKIRESNLKLKSGADVDKIIENIEKRIEDVEEQVQYVKSLKVNKDDRLNKPKFKTADSDEILSNDTKAKRGDKDSNLGSLEKDNEAFLLGDSAENINVSNVAFRAHDDPYKYSAEMETKHITITTSATPTDKKVNGSDVNSSTFNKTEVSKKSKDADASNEKKINGRDSKNTTANEINDEDYKNSIIPLDLKNFTVAFNDESQNVDFK